MTENKIDWTTENVSGFISFFFEIELYSYQQRFIEACLGSKRVAGIWPRQSGKSHTVATYVLFRAITSKMRIIIVAPTQSQSGELYKKIRDMAADNSSVNNLITKCTATELIFENGSRIVSLPCGPEGKTIRGYTADIAIIEEAGFMKDQIVNTVIIPMVGSKGSFGQVIKIGTPWMRNHFYRSVFEDPTYKDSVVSINWEEVLKEGQYKKEFIEEQRIQLTDIEFRTEYNSEFIDDANAFFPTGLLEKCKLNYPMLKYI